MFRPEASGEKSRVEGAGVPRLLSILFSQGGMPKQPVNHAPMILGLHVSASTVSPMAVGKTGGKLEEIYSVNQAVWAVNSYQPLRNDFTITSTRSEIV